MPNPIETDFLGKARGAVFTTSPLEFGADAHGGREGDDRGKKVSIVWKEEHAWRLRLVGRGNEAFLLPGRTSLFLADGLKRRGAGVTIIVASRSGGLGSLHNWLHYGKHRLRALSVNLMEAEMAGGTTEDRLAAIADSLQRQITASGCEQPQTFSKDPIEVLLALHGVKGSPLDVVVLQNFEALDSQAIEILFARLRALYEGAFGARRLPALVLLGHSVIPLLEQQGAFSDLLSLSSFYLMTSFMEKEVRQMAAKVKITRAVEILEILKWTGGHPYLVQAIFRLVQTGGVANPREAIELLLRERPSVFHIWIQQLKMSLRAQETDRVISKMLVRGELQRTPFEPRTSILDLLAQGWIRWTTAENCWAFHSQFHRILAIEAYEQRERQETGDFRPPSARNIIP